MADARLAAHGANRFVDRLPHDVEVVRNPGCWTEINVTRRQARVADSQSHGTGSWNQKSPGPMGLRGSMGMLTLRQVAVPVREAALHEGRTASTTIIQPLRKCASHYLRRTIHDRLNRSAQCRSEKPKETAAAALRAVTVHRGMDDGHQGIDPPITFDNGGTKRGVLSHQLLHIEARRFGSGKGVLQLACTAAGALHE